jgi:hypothetical protein
MGNRSKGFTFYRLAYSNITAKSKSPLLHQVRDGTAFAELAAALYDRGGRLGTTIHLYADDVKRKAREFPLITPHDLLVLTTRPPISDREADAARARKSVNADGKKQPLLESKKMIPRNGGELEAAYLRALIPYFTRCNRKRIELNDHAADLLPEAHKHFRSLELATLGRDHVIRHLPDTPAARGTGHRRYTVAFFFRFPDLPPFGCSIMMAFGMSGFTTLVWNRALRTRFANWIDTRRFVMAKVTIHNVPDYPPPLTPTFADDEEKVLIEVLAEEPLR